MGNGHALPARPGVARKPPAIACRPIVADDITRPAAGTPLMSSFGPKMTDRLADYEITDATDPIAAAAPQSGVAPMSTSQPAGAETDGMSGTGIAPAPIGDIHVHGKFLFAR